MGLLLERIRLIFDSLEKSKTQIAADLNVTPQYIWKLCNSDSVNPSEQFICAFCRVYGVDETWLRTGEGEPYVPKTRNDRIAEFLNEIMAEEDASIRRRWIEAFASLPLEAWELFDRLAVEYVEKKEG